MPGSANDDPGVTAIRPVLPRYVLRGVSGVVFGRNIPLLATTSVGRAHECNLQIDEPGLSRIHARVIPTDDGVQLEDQGSTNGTYINGTRVVRGVAKAGDEIAFDTIRFRLTASNQADPASDDVVEPSPAKRSRRWLMAALVLAPLIAACVVLLMR
jgi:pSer/pThr/pTyr-binding forkhead associated (FHA) protein